jgi:diguanylate cyclase (GGDEF)-like protein
MPTKYKNIWLVDDDPAMLRILSASLTKAKYNVRCFEDGREAIEALSEDNPDFPDFLITDWEMPNMNGLELCRKIRDFDLPGYVYIIFLTAQAGSPNVIEGLDMGADDYLTKPVNQKELLARLRSGIRVLRLERRLSLMARTDALTGIYNRRVFFEELENEWERSNRSGAPLSCVMMDLDFFKQINDTYGHAVGDLVLRKTGKLLWESCRANDIPSRYGGEEFAILMPDTILAEAQKFAERIRKKLEKIPIDTGSDKPLFLSASIGVVQRTPKILTADELVDWSDQALGMAKQAGRNRTVVSHAQEGGSPWPEASSLEKIFSGIQAKRVMTPIVTTMKMEHLIGMAADFFLGNRIHSIPVVDSEGRLAGILSENDIINCLSTPKWWEQEVKEIMQTNLICYPVDSPIQKVYEFLMRVPVRFVVIVEDGKPVGLISRSTLLRWLRNRLANLSISAKAKNMQAADPESTLKQILQTSTAIQEETALLVEYLEKNKADSAELTPHLIDSATTIEELTTQLLGYIGSTNTETEMNTIHGLLEQPRQEDEDS